MRDSNLRLMLWHEVFVERAVVELEDGNPRTPRYVREAEARKALIQPLQGALRADLMGKLPESTHVVYLEAAVVPTEVLVCGERRYEVLAVDDEAGQGHHWRAVVKAVGE